MSQSLEGYLVVAISSTVLFDMTESDHVYHEQGVTSYCQYQIDHETDTLKPGPAFYFVKKLLALNKNKPVVEVILLSRNNADTGLRVFNSIEAHKLDIRRAAFTSGENPYSYVKAFSAHLFLSTHHQDVRAALDAGCAAANLLPNSPQGEHSKSLKIAFDGDSVLFSDEAERIFQESGIAAFSESEKQSADIPLPGGPFKDFLSALYQLQQQFADDSCPIRTALITAREAPAHTRVIKTLRHWGIRIDEAIFLGGLDKAAFLKSFDADIFFDDQSKNCIAASEHVTTGHVPHGITNA